MPRPMPPTPLVTQTDSGDRIRWDDCHPACAAMALFRATRGAKSYTWRELRAALEKRGIHDVPNVSNPVNEPQAIQALIDVAPEVKGQIRPAPTWDSLLEILKAGGGYVCLFWMGALPPAYDPGHNRGVGGHACYVELDGEIALWFDPLRPKGSEPKRMPLAELKRLAHWGLEPTNAKRRHPAGWAIKASPAPIEPPKPPVINPPKPPANPCASIEAELAQVKAEKAQLEEQLRTSNARIAAAKTALG